MEYSPNELVINYPGGFRFDEEPSEDQLTQAWSSASQIAKFWVKRLYGEPPSENGIAAWLRNIRNSRLNQLQQ